MFGENKNGGLRVTSAAKGRRRPRASFERTLARIIQKIERMAVHDVSFKLLSWHDEKKLSKIAVKHLWAAGSFARGATTCGDLDLVMEIDLVEGSYPPTRIISSQIVGRYPDVAIYIGTPDENSAHIVFPEAVLLWSHDDSDWRTALGRIQSDGNSSRFARRCDALPLRREQFFYDGDLDDLVDLADKKVIIWEWIPLEDLDTGKIDDIPVAKDFVRKTRILRGEKSADSFLWAISHFHSLSLPWSWNHIHVSRTHISMGGTDIFTGSAPTLRLAYLDSLSCSSIALIPHITRRGPNGIWIISRGPEHPLEKDFRDVKCSVRVNGAGEPIFQCDNKGEYGLRLYGPGHKRQPVNLLNGSELLSLLSTVTWFSVGRATYRLKSLRVENEGDAIEHIRRLCH